MWSLPSPIWADIGNQLLGRIEQTYDFTVFSDSPKGLTQLPGALGGDPGQQDALASQASTSQGFLEILRAKAHFFRLPERIINDLSDTGTLIVFSDLFLGNASAKNYAIVSTGIGVQLASDVPRFVASWGAEVGTQSAGPDYTRLGTIYHEFCHAWMLDAVANDPFWQDLETQSMQDYANAVTANGQDVDPKSAYREAAGSYVDVRVQGWYRLVLTFSKALLIKGTVPQARMADLLSGARAEYNSIVDRQVFGYVDGSAIVQPGLHAPLREALDTYVLDSLPLTRKFEESPLRIIDETVFGGAAMGDAPGPANGAPDP